MKLFLAMSRLTMMPVGMMGAIGLMTVTDMVGGDLVVRAGKVAFVKCKIVSNEFIYRVFRVYSIFRGRYRSRCFSGGWLSLCANIGTRRSCACYFDVRIRCGRTPWVCQRIATDTSNEEIYYGIPVLRDFGLN
jgi:hypothetical protein